MLPYIQLFFLVHRENGEISATGDTVSSRITGGVRPCRAGAWKWQRPVRGQGQPGHGRPGDRHCAPARAPATPLRQARAQSQAHHDHNYDIRPG